MTTHCENEVSVTEDKWFKLNLTEEDKAGLIEAINKGVEPTPDCCPSFFPGMAEKFDVQALDRAKIPTLEYAGKRSKAAILAEAMPVSAPHRCKPCATWAKQKTGNGKI